MAALLPMYAVMPAFAAVAYVPSITLGEFNTLLLHDKGLPRCFKSQPPTPLQAVAP
jgi:hypothetical protein